MVGHSAGLTTEVTTLLIPVVACVLTVIGTVRVVTSCALENGRGVRGRFGIWLVNALGTGSVGSDTAIADLVGMVLTAVNFVAGFCSKSTG